MSQPPNASWVVPSRNQTELPTAAVGRAPKIGRMLADLVRSTGGDFGTIVRFVEGDMFILEWTYGQVVLGRDTRVPTNYATNYIAAARGECIATSDYPSMVQPDRPLDRLALSVGIEGICTVPLSIAMSPGAAVTIGTYDRPWDHAAAREKMIESGRRLLVELTREPASRVSSRVFVCHDDILSAEGLARVSEKELGISDPTICTRIDQVIDAVRETSDLVVTDCFVAGERIDDQVRALAVGGTTPRILVIASHDTDKNRAAAAQAGVYGYCAKGSSRQAISAAFLNVASGQYVRPTRIPNIDLNSNLTERELNVLLLLEQGLQVKQVALALMIAETTVKGYIRNIFVKLDVHSTTTALYVARQSGLLDSRRSEDLQVAG